MGGQTFFFPPGIPLGIVNSEVNCSAIPQNQSQGCVYENFSCRRIKSLEQTKKFKLFIFETFDEAWKFGKAGKLNGIIHFKKNLTEKFLKRLEAVEKIEIDEELDVVDFYADHSDLHMAQFVFDYIKESIEIFLLKLARDCNFNTKFAVISPVKIEEPIYSYPNDSYLGDIIYSYYYG
jgi:hypothetical protein